MQSAQEPDPPPSLEASQHDRCWSPGLVSVWSGEFPSLDEADAYFAETYANDERPISQFAQDLGIRAYRSDCLEYRFDDVDSRPVRQIVAECSFSESYADELLRAAAQRGVERTQGVALLFHSDIALAGKPVERCGPLRFLGVFRFQMITGRPWLDRLVARTRRHPAAYLTILDALRATRARPESNTAESGTARVDAAALCDAIRAHADATYGELARDRLLLFGLGSSEAAGEATAELIDAGILRAEEGDRPEDFQGLFRL